MCHRPLPPTASPHNTPVYLNLQKPIEAKWITIRFTTESPRKIEAGSVALTALPTPPITSAEENHDSFGLRVEHGATSMFLNGDSGGRSARS